MARVSSSFVCQQCGFRSSQFLGRCPECGTWSSLVEESESHTSQKSQRVGKVTEIVKISDVTKEGFDRLSTKLSEFDRVLGGGIVKGSVVLLAGDPGIGKSTLLSQLSINVENT